MHGTSSTPASLFVGRTWELGQLRDGLSEGGARRGSVYLVSGEAGIGKTRLARRLAELAEQEQHRVLWGRCWEGEASPAFWPWSLGEAERAIDSLQRAASGHRASSARGSRRTLPASPRVRARACPGAGQAFRAAPCPGRRRVVGGAGPRREGVVPAGGRRRPADARPRPFGGPDPLPIVTSAGRQTPQATRSAKAERVEVHSEFGFHCHYLGALSTW